MENISGVYAMRKLKRSGEYRLWARRFLALVYSPLRLGLRMAYTPLAFSIDDPQKTPGPITCEQTAVHDLYDSASSYTNQYTCNANTSREVHQYRLLIYHPITTKLSQA